MHEKNWIQQCRDLSYQYAFMGLCSVQKCEHNSQKCCIVDEALPIKAVKTIVQKSERNRKSGKTHDTDGIASNENTRFQNKLAFFQIIRNRK